MKLLFVSRFDRSARAINTIVNYARVGTRMGHQIALYSDPLGDLPDVPTSRDVKAFDYLVFVVYETPDFPDLPHLAWLLDSVPRDRRVVIDCTGRCNATITVEHDFNHQEKMDNHQGWEWIDGFQAVAATILQPTLKPQRSDVTGFLFHGFDPAAVERRYETSAEAARAWSAGPKELGLAYVGNNWQRWSQMRALLAALEPIAGQIGPISLTGWAWDYRPDWAAELGIEGINTDGAFLQRLGAQLQGNIAFNQVIALVSKARFSPVIHRPLFNHLGLVTNRTFETFCSDVIPLLMLPREMVEAIHGPAATALICGDGAAARERVADMLRTPEVYWDAVLKTRAHLARAHSFQQRLAELETILR